MTLKRLPNGEIEFGEAKRNVDGSIDCVVSVVELDEVVPFTASPDDCEECGVELYHLLSGKYASQVASVSPEEIEADAIAAARVRRVAELQASDWTQLPDVSLPNKEDWAAYRQALRDVPLQQGYPLSISWPIPPEL